MEVIALGEKSKCPECGDQIEDLRATCPNCGHEYSSDDYDNEEYGNEFMAGANIDDEGNEILDEGPGVETTKTEEEEQVREATRSH